MLLAFALFTLVVLFLLVGRAGRALPRHLASPVSLAVENLEERLTSSTYTQSNIAYGTDPAQVLDI
jgi:hypothetical protein